MIYKFLYTERTNEKASEFETKSLLYLFSMREDSNEIDTFIIDCFNDVTGANSNCDKLWDVQSKAVKSLNPTKIGEAYKLLNKQVILSSTLKDEEYSLLKYDEIDNVNAIDYNNHESNKILQKKYTDKFAEILDLFNVAK